MKLCATLLSASRRGTPLANNIHVKRAVTCDLCLPGKSQIAREILLYLTEYPDAQDTMDGIVQWWLLERKINYQRLLVKEALDELIERGFVIKQGLQSNDSDACYLLDKQKIVEIKKLLSDQKE